MFFNNYRKYLYLTTFLLSFTVFVAFYNQDLFFSIFMQTAGPFAIRLFSLILLTASLTGTGMVLALLLRVGEATRKSFATCFLLGVVLTSSTLFVLGLARILYMEILIALLITGLVAFIIQILKDKELLKTKVERIHTFIASSDFWTLLFLSIIGISVFIPLVATFYPPFFSDEIAYHLLNPKNFLNERAIHAAFEEPYSLFPVHMEMIYMYAMGLFSDNLPKLVHWFLHILSLLLLYRIARRSCDARTATGAAALFALTPVISFYSSTAFITSGIIVFFLASFFFMLKYLKTAAKEDAVVFALFSSFLLVIHHSAIMFLFSFFLIIIWNQWKTKRFSDMKTILLVIIVFMAVASPYYLRNLLTTGNPVYPVLSSFFEVKNWNSFVDYSISRQFYFTKGTGRGLFSLLRLPYDATFHFKSFSTLKHDMGIGPLYLLCLPFLLINLKKVFKGPLRPATICLLFCTVFWFFLMPHFFRFLFPVLSLACLLLCSACNDFFSKENNRILKTMTAGLILTAAGLNIIMIVQILHPPHLSQVISGHFQDDEFLRNVNGYQYLSAFYLSEQEKDNTAAVAFMKNFNPYYCKLKAYSFYTSPTLSKTFMTEERIKAIRKKGGYSDSSLYNCFPETKENILKDCKRMNIKYIVLSIKEKKELSNENLDNLLNHSRLLLKMNELLIYELEYKN